MQQCNLADFSFSLQNQNDIEVEQQTHFLGVNSSAADISSEEENDLDRKIQQLYSQTKQALQSIKKRQISEQVNSAKDLSNVKSCLVCSKSLPFLQLFVSKKVFARNNKIKGFTAIQYPQHLNSINKSDNQQDQKQKLNQKIQNNSYFSVPKRNICYSYIKI
ncbi:unnamed protein product (macronuclear) [Paramecium tetraurelia]|uniref:Uncharacterized protein n=1 Tax=Paramecium tetraurelia TaxID=5888 RepID=A0BVX4_PARTE|nr:uncharacterized protein GSPATT00032543001 [Paramecium tetraurelia]CAK62691.1 unnamed protein product [Paramecium tetraurelia]|eukprot:XP_001430089.1 hypothetical protein (macronuclear) [Paramecium tetraurelia strain d4-2]